LKSNPQQILRWGFTPQPPPSTTAEEHHLLPSYLLQQSFPDLRKVIGFDGGVYKLKLGRKTSALYHYGLMAGISESRQVHSD
jgi:hypothetical protein